MQSVGFKEWAVVCEALGRGEQSLLLRKGGIAEGQGGFGFRHSEFFLFPTFFHEQVGKVREPGVANLAPREGEIEIRYFARLEAETKIHSWAVAASLEPFHGLAEAVVRERFDYDEAGLHVALVRVFRLTPGWIFPDAPAFGGCRSWVNLPEIPAKTRLQPALTDEKHAEVARAIRAVLGNEDEV